MGSIVVSLTCTAYLFGALIAFCFVTQRRNGVIEVCNFFYAMRLMFPASESQPVCRNAINLNYPGGATLYSFISREVCSIDFM